MRRHIRLLDDFYSRSLLKCVPLRCSSTEHTHTCVFFFIRPADCQSHRVRPHERYEPWWYSPSFLMFKYTHTHTKRLYIYGRVKKKKKRKKTSIGKEVEGKKANRIGQYNWKSRPFNPFWCISIEEFFQVCLCIIDLFELRSRHSARYFANRSQCIDQINSRICRWASSISLYI